jgi:hypothetical protein
MKWILILIVLGPDTGAHTNSFPFETKELCEAAKTEANFKRGWANAVSFCAQVKL